MPYYFGPYVQDTGSWRPPVTVTRRGDYFAGLPLPPRNGTPWGIFATHATISDGTYTALGNWGDPARAAMRDVLRNAFQRPAGAYTGTPQTLGEAILDAWQSWSDPEGLSAPKPLIPAKGKLTLSLGQTREIPWTWGDLGTTKIQSVIHADRRYYAAEVAAGRMTREKAGQILSADMRRLKASAKVLVPTGVDITPVKPRTSYSDTFDGTGSLGANWERTNGFTTLARSSGRVVLSGSGACLYRYNADVSSVDHWATLSDIVRSSGLGGVVRHSDSAATCYFGYVNSGTILTIRKLVAGMATQLLFNFNGPAADGGTLTLDASGSTIAFKSGETTYSSVSNSDITTGLRGGIYMVGTGPSADSWLVDDGVATGSLLTTLLQHNHFAGGIAS